MCLSYHSATSIRSFTATSWFKLGPANFSFLTWGLRPVGCTRKTSTESCLISIRIGYLNHFNWLPSMGRSSRSFFQSFPQVVHLALTFPIACERDPKKLQSTIFWQRLERACSHLTSLYVPPFKNWKQPPRSATLKSTIPRGIKCSSSFKTSTDRRPFVRLIENHFKHIQRDKLLNNFPNHQRKEGNRSRIPFNLRILQKPSLCADKKDHTTRTSVYWVHIITRHN